MSLVRRLAPALRHLPGARGAAAAFVAERAALGTGPASARTERTIDRLLAEADRALDGGDLEVAADLATKAQLLAFDPARLAALAPRHAPATDDAVVAPFRRSVTGRLLHGPLPLPLPVLPSPPSSSEPAAGHDGPLRLLVVAYRNLTFIERVLVPLRARDDVTVQVLDLEDLDLAATLREGPLTAARLRAARDGRRLAPPPALAEALAACDAVLVEWGHRTLAYMSLLEGVGAAAHGVPLLARVHRYELDTPYIHLVDTARVDDWIFIAGHIARRVRHQLGLAEDRVHLVPNVGDLDRFAAAKEAGAERVLVHDGWARPRKDAGFALDVLEALHADDPSWRLLLLGPPPGTTGTDDAVRAARALRERVAALGDAVVPLGQRDDMDAVLARAGFVLSTSRSEGSHELVAEAAAAACVPVVRDWPDDVAYGGAASVYPGPWVVADREEAVARIRALADPAARTSAGREARERILADRDPGRVIEEFLRVVRATAAR